jgi:RimJ/RimL family protein N-acetyltransferase
VPEMTDPSAALESFQRAFAAGEIQLRHGEIDPDIFLYADRINDQLRLTYVRLAGRTVTAFVNLTPVNPVEGTPCLQIGCAVPEAYRGQGRAKDAIKAALTELKHGLARANISTFYVEAIVSTDNEASKHVAAATISAAPIAVTDKYSGLPALQYLLKIGQT